MTFKNILLSEYQECNHSLIDSAYENFLSYKKLFELVYQATEKLEYQEYKDFCKDVNITPHEAKTYARVYDLFFKPDIKEYRITDEVARRAKKWDKYMWLEFSKIYEDEKNCRKTLFCILLTGKLRYKGITIPVEELTLNDIKRFKSHINKFKSYKSKDITAKFKSLRTRLNNFINKEFKSYTKADKEILEQIKTHHNNLIALIEEHLENANHEAVDSQEITETKEDKQEFSTFNTSDMLDSETIEEIPSREWFKKINRFLSTDLYKLYENGDNLKVNWNNPYYAVIFLNLDIFNLPSAEEYRKMYKEMILLFHPDNKEENAKTLASKLTSILNDINLNVWGANGERYTHFINSIKFSIMKLGV